LGERLDTPIDALGERALMLGVTRRAMDLYAAVLREASQGDIAAALVIARAVIEAMILVRWIEDAPELRIAMYHADDDRQRLMIIRKALRHGIGTGYRPLRPQSRPRRRPRSKRTSRLSKEGARCGGTAQRGRPAATSDCSGFHVSRPAFS
jgi:hypothetical protein